MTVARSCDKTVTGNVTVTGSNDMYYTFTDTFHMATLTELPHKNRILVTLLWRTIIHGWPKLLISVKIVHDW